jgi:hypothetical protein
MTVPKSSAIGLAALVLILAACSSSTPTASSADGGGGGSQATPGSGATEPGSGQATDAPSGAPYSGSLKDLAHQLAPDGSTEVTFTEAPGVYQLYLTSTLNLDQITAFYDSRIPSLGMKIEGKTVSSGSLYIGTSNPAGAIIAAPDPSAGGYTVVISLGSQ